MIYYKFTRIESIYYFCEIDYVFKTEQWKPIIGFEGIYEVSDLGRIKAISRNYKNKNGVFYHKKEIILKSHINKGYLKIQLRTKELSKSYSVHQVVSISFLGHVIFGHKLVINRVLNLEIITHRENCNKKHIKSSSKYVGVYWLKRKCKWQSKIQINGKNIVLGIFEDEEEAGKYYQEALSSYNNGLKIKIKKHIYTSKYKGVSWDKVNKKWLAKIYLNKKSVNLGRFNTEIEANNRIKKYLISIN
jgi:hypothetical protein